jgi:hypothetical protein
VFFWGKDQNELMSDAKSTRKMSNKKMNYVMEKRGGALTLKHLFSDCPRHLHFLNENEIFCCFFLKIGKRAEGGKNWFWQLFLLFFSNTEIFSKGFETSRE